MRRFYALTAPFVARLTQPQDYVSRDILQPEETEDVAPPWISQACIDRITASAIWGGLNEQMEMLHRTQVTHGAVVRFSHGPGIVGPDGFALRDKRLRLSSRFTLNTLTHRLSETPQVAYANSFASARFFGHWLTDSIPATCLVKDASYYLTNKESWAHCTAYREAFGLRANDTAYLLAEDVITYVDFSQGSLKRQRYATLKARLAQAMPPPATAEKVFLWRGSTGEARDIQDGNRARDRLRQGGWEVIDVTAPLPQIHAALAGAQVVAGMEGSHLNHVHFCSRPGTTMVVLTPHDRFTTVQVGLARAVGNFCGFCVLAGNAKDGYELDFDVFEKAVEHSRAKALQAR